MSKEQLLAKLRKISALYDTAEGIRERMEDFCPPDNYERKVSLPPFPGGDEYMVTEFDHMDDAAMDNIRSWHEQTKAPQKPAPLDVRDWKEPAMPADMAKKKSNMKYSAIFCGVIGAFVGLTVVSDLQSADALTIVIALALIGACVYAALQSKKVDKAYETFKEEDHYDYEAKMIDRRNQYNDDMAAYEQAYAQHKEAQEAFMAAYADWRKIYLAYAAEEAVIADKLEADRRAAVAAMEAKELAPVLDEMNALNDVVGEDYLPVIDDLIELIAAGRADSVKEAINLYEEMVYREEQLEAERQAAEQRRADEERRYREEMAFREQQERTRQREAEAQRAAEERRHQEEMKQRDEMEAQRKKEKAEEERRRARAESERKAADEKAKYEQCLRCANKARCSMFGSKRPDCSGFRPA